MSVKVLTRIMFIAWITAITVLAVIPHSDDGIMISSNVTTSGMEKHLIGYFIAALLCYYGFKRGGILFILMCGVLIFLYSVVLETVQFFLPYRTFNVYDVVGNGVGIGAFCLIYLAKTNNRMKSHTGLLG